MTSPAERAIVVPLSRRNPHEAAAGLEALNAPIDPVLSGRTEGHEEFHDVVRVDCHGCTARPVACGDCVVTYLLGSPPEGVDLAADEQEALEVLAASGLVPSLQYSPSSDPITASGRPPATASHLRSIGGPGSGLPADFRA